MGNSGKKYSGNRHNVGFMIVDGLVKELRVRGYGLHQDWKKSTKGKLQYIWFDVDGKKFELVRPQVFMNDSGYSVAYAYKNHPELEQDDIYIIHDDLDLPLGSYKIQKGKGPREHRGLLSIYESLGNKDFWHVRVGVDNRKRMSNVNPFGKPFDSELRAELLRIDTEQGRSIKSPRPRQAKRGGQMSKIISGEKYVLQDFTKDELEILVKTINNIVSELLTMLS